MNYIYAQLNEQNICVGISTLSGEVPEYNYSENKTFNPITGEFEMGEHLFISRMIPVQVYSDSYLGLKYNDGVWEQVATV